MYGILGDLKLNRLDQHLDWRLSGKLKCFIKHYPRVIRWQSSLSCLLYKELAVGNKGKKIFFKSTLEIAVSERAGKGYLLDICLCHISSTLVLLVSCSPRLSSAWFYTQLHPCFCRQDIHADGGSHRAEELQADPCRGWQRVCWYRQSFL